MLCRGFSGSAEFCEQDEVRDEDVAKLVAAIRSRVLRLRGCCAERGSCQRLRKRRRRSTMTTSCCWIWARRRCKAARRWANGQANG
ncbi:MAG: hypothetical protein WAT39_22380, partial [Planctomycetota bacterium]